MSEREPTHKCVCPSVRECPRVCGHEWNECCVHFVILFFFPTLLPLLSVACFYLLRRRRFMAFLSRLQQQQQQHQQQCHLTVPVPQLNLGLAAAILWLRSPWSYRNFMKCSDEATQLCCVGAQNVPIAAFYVRLH